MLGEGAVKGAVANPQQHRRSNQGGPTPPHPGSKPQAHPSAPHRVPEGSVPLAPAAAVVGEGADLGGGGELFWGVGCCCWGALNCVCLRRGRLRSWDGVWDRFAGGRLGAAVLGSRTPSLRHLVPKSSRVPSQSRVPTWLRPSQSHASAISFTLLGVGWAGGRVEGLGVWGASFTGGCLRVSRLNHFPPTGPPKQCSGK